MMAKDDYPYIRANGKRWGSNQDFIDGEVAAARTAKAPADAWSRTKDEPDGPWKWNTVTELRALAKRGNVQARDTLNKLGADL